MTNILGLDNMNLYCVVGLVLEMFHLYSYIVMLRLFQIVM